MLTEGFPRAWRLIRFCGRNWVVGTSLQLRKRLPGPFIPRDAAVCCKAVMFDVASGSGTVGGVELLRRNVTNPSEGVAESFVTSGGFSTLESIAQRQADERFVGA